MLLLLPAALLHEPGEVRLGRRPPLARAFSRPDEGRELGRLDVLDVLPAVSESLHAMGFAEDARALHEETLLQLELCQERNPENRPLRRLLQDIRNLELTGAR